MEIYEVTVRSGESIKKVVSDYILRQGWESVYLTGAIGSVIGCEISCSSCFHDAFNGLSS